MEQGGSTWVRQPAPWVFQRGLGAVLERWKDNGAIRRSFVLDVEQEGRDGSFRPIPDELAPSIRAALESRGIRHLYEHQARAFELAAAGKDFVIATPTASGKSLCYHLPVLHRLSLRSSARAIYVFPTKALARDQEESVRALMRDAALDHGAITYDGDTPGDARRAARERCGILITNPDMLHAGILPHHASWARLFADLEVVVIDELHVYRGVFGSHLANVIRRLHRIARFHGANPTFLFASATIKNPREHASRLLGREVELISESGAPAGPRRVMVYDPPVINAEVGIRASYTKSAVKLTGDLVAAGVPTLVFGQSRNQVEVMLKYLRDRLAQDGLDPALVDGYRGGYLPDTRRRIEAGLREGAIRCVVATSALELGIDVGSLDAVVCAGYPGSIAALWQRFGRAGRRKSGSLAVLVTSSAPLDQYFAREPNLLIGSPVEEARVDPDNIEILLAHVKCAAFELPFEAGEGLGDVPAEVLGDALEFLAGHEVLVPVPGRAGKPVYHWSSDAYPANAVSLRSASYDNFVIIEIEEALTLAEMDWRSTHTMLHEQAIYQHGGEQFQVERLDFDNHKAFVRRVEPDYYTTAMTHTKVRVLHQDNTTDLRFGGAAGLHVGLGDVNVVEKVVGYKKIKFHTHENVGYGEVDLPQIEKPTTSIWIEVPLEAIRRIEVPRSVAIDGLRGIASAMHTAAAVGLMSDPRDIGAVVVDPLDRGESGDPATDPPTLYIYDQVAGGIGLAPRLFENCEDLLRRAARLVSACTCEDGCPACVGPVSVLPREGRVWSRKRVALDLLGGLGVLSM